MKSHSPSIIGGMLLVIGGVLGACSSPGSAGPATGGSSSAVSEGSSSTVATSATALVTTPPAGTSSSQVGSDEPSNHPTMSEAPAAFLVLGGNRFAGEVGGFTFGTSGQDAPWLPASALDRIDLAAGSKVRVELDGRAAIAAWTARIATAADTTADNVTGLAEDDGPTAEFAAPAKGDWVLSLTITYGEGRGSGAYYWELGVR